jgi:hypothetical protein
MVPRLLTASAFVIPTPVSRIISILIVGAGHVSIGWVWIEQSEMITTKKMQNKKMKQKK